MTNEEKLEVLKGFLRENNIWYKEGFKQKENIADLYIPKYRIIVRISKADDHSFYESVRYYFHPLFIRDKETAEFVVEKMQNLIIELMKAEHERLNGKSSKR